MNNESHNPFPAIEDRLGSVPGATGAETWVEGAYGDGAWMSSEAPNSSEFIGLAAKRRRVIFFFVCMAVLLGVLWGKTGLLMAQSGSFKLRSDQNRIRTVVTSAERGIILDRNGLQLSENVPDLQLAVVPADLPEDAAARHNEIVYIATLGGVDPAAAEAALGDFRPKGYQPVTIAANITRDQAVDLTIARSDHPAVRIIDGSHRFYSLSNTLTSLSHLLGYMGRITAEDLKKPDIKNYQPSDSIGRTGLESSYEKDLAGKPGFKKVEVDAVGNEVGVVGEQDPMPGSNLRLAIDIGLTTAAESSLKAIMQKSHLTRGAVVVEDVRNGEILSLVSLPSFSNNDFSGGISTSEYSALINDPDHPLFNRAVSGVYPPGSTAKLMIAAAALAEGVVTPSTTVNSTGGIMYGGTWWFPDWKAGGHGITNVTKAIAWSVNTFFYMIGGGYESFSGLGIERLEKYFVLFGLGKPLGIDLPNEASGLVPTPEWKKAVQKTVWYIGDTYHVSIGQGDLLTTPLQMVSWTSTVANGGTVWRPHLAQAFLDNKGSVLKTVEPLAIRTSIISDKYLATVREGMRETVTIGSAQSLKNVGMDVAGKTGTAQVSGKDNHAWFAGYGPFKDPQIAVVVLVEQGKEGSSVAVPVARDIFDWWARNRMKHGT